MLYVSVYSTRIPLVLIKALDKENDSDSNERRWPTGNQLIDTPSVDKQRDEERGDRSRRARKRR